MDYEVANMRNIVSVIMFLAIAWETVLRDLKIYDKCKIVDRFEARLKSALSLFHLRILAKSILAA